MERSEEAQEALTTRAAVFEEEMVESTSSLEELIDCVRYGLMEMGGFVRHQTLNREQRTHMLVQERGNLVLWNVRNRADTTGSALETDAQQETGEEEVQTMDPEGSPDNGTEVLLENLRRDQNNALAGERWSEANQIQRGIMVILESTTGPSPGRLSVDEMTTIRNIFQRLYRYHRNRGSDERAERYQTYVTDMQSLMR